MEPRQEKPEVPQPPKEPPKKRFQLVKLEERIAPRNGGRGPTNGRKCNTTGTSIDGNTCTLCTT
jgi:hypothetical protein